MGRSFPLLCPGTGRPSAVRLSTARAVKDLAAAQESLDVDLAAGEPLCEQFLRVIRWTPAPVTSRPPNGPDCQSDQRCPAQEGHKRHRDPVVGAPASVFPNTSGVLLLCPLSEAEWRSSEIKAQCG